MATGHGTIISTEDGQGENRIWIFDTGGSSELQTGTFDFIPNGQSASIGDVFSIASDGSDASSSVVLQSKGSRARGSINDTGAYSVSISDSGDTGLSGEVEIDLSGNFGNNDGFSGKVEVSVVDGQAVYLS